MIEVNNFGILLDVDTICMVNIYIYMSKTDEYLLPLPNSGLVRQLTVKWMMI
jgi:hypothetical protein